MINHSLTSNYNLKWQFVFDNKYKVSTCKNIFNIHTGRKLKECVNCYTVGYWFGKKFIPKNKLNNYIELIPNYDCTF